MTSFETPNEQLLLESDCSILKYDNALNSRTHSLNFFALNRKLYKYF